MPTYQYRCTKCKHEFEEFQSISDDPLDTCPKCAGPIQRVISGGAGLLFKGGGFYITDYRSEGYKKDAKKDAPKSADKKPGDDAKKKPGGSSGSSGSD
jgi:putative FmdB family regulatory protein